MIFAILLSLCVLVSNMSLLIDLQWQLTVCQRLLCISLVKFIQIKYWSISETPDISNTQTIFCWGLRYMWPFSTNNYFSRWTVFVCWCDVENFLCSGKLQRMPNTTIVFNKGLAKCPVTSSSLEMYKILWIHSKRAALSTQVNEILAHWRNGDKMPSSNCFSWQLSIHNQLLFSICLVKNWFPSTFTLSAMSLEVRRGGGHYWNIQDKIMQSNTAGVQWILPLSSL